MCTQRYVYAEICVHRYVCAEMCVHRDMCTQRYVCAEICVRTDMCFRDPDNTTCCTLIKDQGKAIPLQAYHRPWVFQELEAPFLYSRHIKVIRLSALCHGRLVLIFVRVKIDSRQSVAGEIMSMKNPKTSLGIEPVTLWLVTHCLNQLCYHVPHSSVIPTTNKTEIHPRISGIKHIDGVTVSWVGNIVTI